MTDLLERLRSVVYLNHGKWCQEAAEEIERLTAEVTRLAGLYEREEREHGETVDRRDRIEELATSLANLVGEAYGVDVGEHSNLNCPITEACEELNYILAMRQAVREPDEVLESLSGSHQHEWETDPHKPDWKLCKCGAGLPPSITPDSKQRCPTCDGTGCPFPDQRDMCRVHHCMDCDDGSLKLAWTHCPCCGEKVIDKSVESRIRGFFELTRADSREKPLHDDVCGSLFGRECDCPSAAWVEKGQETL